MIRLIGAELRKVWHSRFFWLAMAVLLGSNLFLLWFGTSRGTDYVPARAYRTLQAEAAQYPMPQLGEMLNEQKERVQGIINIDVLMQNEAAMGRVDHDRRALYAEDFDLYYDDYLAGNYLRYCDTLAQEYRFLAIVTDEFAQVDGYEEFLDSIQVKAKQLSSVSIFAQSNGNYNLDNIRITAEDFADMHGIPIRYFPQKGLMTALDFALTDVVAVFAMLLIAVVLVRSERDNGLLAMVRCTPAGRHKTAAAKLAAFGLTLAVILLALYGMNLAYCGAQFGLGSLTRSIQSVPELMRSTLKLTVGEYIGCFLLTKWAAAFVCGVWVMLAMLLARRLLGGALGALGLVGANLLVRSVVPATSNWNVLKYANLVSMLRTNELLGRYRNLYWFDSPVPLVLVECITALALGALFTAAFCTVFTRWYFTPARHRSKGLRRRRLRFTTPMRTEWFKQLALQGGAVLLIILIGVQVYTAVTTENYKDATEIYKRYYTQRVEGFPTREKLDWLNEQDKEFLPIHQLEAARRAGLLTPDQFSAAMGTYESLLRKMNVYQSVVWQWNDLVKKPRMQIVYETGWLKLFDISDRQDLPDALMLALLCALCFCGMFAAEKQTGMVKVIGTTPLGREYTVKIKLRVTAYLCGAFTLLSLLPRVVGVVRDYGLGAWLAPVYSIRQYAGSPEVPLFMMAGMLVLMRFLAVFCCACVVLALSQRIGNTAGALFASALLFGLPPLLSLAGLTDAKWIGLYTPLHLCAMCAQGSGWGLLWLCLFFIGGLCFICIEYIKSTFAMEAQRR